MEQARAEQPRILLGAGCQLELSTNLACMCRQLPPQEFPLPLLRFDRSAACSVGWFVSLLVREEVLLAGLCERKILFQLKIYDRLRQATTKRTGF